MTYDSTKHVRVRRSANPQPVDGNLVRVADPVALTLTGRPANQRPFQIIRADGEATPVKRVTRKVQRNDSPVLCLTFPDTFTEADVTETLANYDMAHYVVEVDAAGIYTAKRSDLQSIADLDVTKIKLNDQGIVASIDAAQYSIQRADTKDNIALVAFEFDTKRFDADAVSSWIAQNNVDTAQPAVENATSNSITVKRSEVAEGTDTRRVQLEEGVVAVIARSEIADVPQPFIECVGESAYGNWGWGHIDFDTSMADRAFCNAMEDASYRLRSILDNILLHNQLPLEARKTLVDRSLAQYGEYVKNVIDALPRQVMLLVTRSAEPKESNEMINVGQQTTANVQRADTAATPAATPAVVAAPAAAPATESAPADEAVTLTRAELQAQIDTAVTAALAQRTDAAASAAAPATETTTTEQRADAAPATGAVITGDLTISDPAITQQLSRSDIAAIVAEAQKPLLEKIEAMSNTVIVRSDAGDRAVTTPENKNVKRSVEDIFAGSFAFPK